MMTREEVVEVAKLKPNGFGFTLNSIELLNLDDLSNKMRDSVPSQWATLVEASGEFDFFTELINLWRLGCGSDALAPNYLERSLRYAGFSAIRGNRVRIEYVCESLENDGTLSHFSALPPIDKTKLREWPDYGPLTRFCEKVHGSINSLSSGTFLRHPAYESIDPFSEKAATGLPWSKFYAETMDDMEEPMLFSEGNVDKTDDENFRPNLETTILFSESDTYHFVEPGDPARFWRFWSSRGDMELQDGNCPDEVENPVDECLSYILGAEF